LAAKRRTLDGPSQAPVASPLTVHEWGGTVPTKFHDPSGKKTINNNALDHSERIFM
jgi:hypothetical protein